MTEDQQDQLVISLDTQYAVAHAIYNRFHANGHRANTSRGKTSTTTAANHGA